MLPANQSSAGAVHTCIEAAAFMFMCQRWCSNPDYCQADVNNWYLLQCATQSPIQQNMTLVHASSSWGVTHTHAIHCIQNTHTHTRHVCGHDKSESTSCAQMRLNQHPSACTHSRPVEPSDCVSTCASCAQPSSRAVPVARVLVLVGPVRQLPKRCSSLRPCRS